jgi:propionyl-CoA carboxylase alpha chain
MPAPPAVANGEATVLISVAMLMALITRTLVANRGEIARRVFSTCRAMGIDTVAVYSEPDRDAPFVREATVAVALGGAAPSDSYLRIDAIVEAAKRTGADAVHPGYGFLSENADFARAVIDAGITWVGPPPEAIATMGSKLDSKRLVEEAGVPTLPSFDLSGLTPERASSAAAEIGYPVLVKASAGGGGKGMRIVADPSALGEAVEAARRESEAAFGDDTVFLERYLEAPRHVEIQVFADGHGSVVSLFERECSIQRRHQKIIEETPSPAVDAELRHRMGEAAVETARAVGYVGAGTVEFLVQDGAFHFLEMNTRLQVEHPVTEMVTGLDLVRLQLLVAMGEPLPPEALRPTQHGHAIEARLYAEDPAIGFLPVTGRLGAVRFPTAEGVRVDSGVEDGSLISTHYDPMLAKVIAWAPTRREAASLLATTLQRSRLEGSITNRELLVRILRHPDFVAGRTDTHFLDRHDPADLGRPLLDPESTQAAAVAAALSSQLARRHSAPVLESAPSGWRNVPSGYQTVDYDGPHGVVTVSYRFDRRGELDVEGYDTARLVVRPDDEIELELDSLMRWYRVRRDGTTSHVMTAEGPVTLVELPRFPSVEDDEEPGSLHAPMPGTVIRVAVGEGDAVEEGDVLVVLEAMKMEHVLRAPHPGVVTSLHAVEGDPVAAGTVLVVVGEAG